MFCSSCGKETIDGAKFCAGCGKDFNERSSSQTIPTKKKASKKMLFGCGFLGTFVILFSLIIGTCFNSTSPSSSNSPSVPAYTGPAVEYRITGSAVGVSVTLNNPTGGTEQFDKVYLPKTYSFDSFPDRFLYISAQNLGEYGRVTTEIYVKGKLIKSATSSGAYVIATSSAMK